MKKKLLAFVIAAFSACGVMAENVSGITVEYVAEGTSSYVQALSAIGKIKFVDVDKVKHAVIEFKDKKASNEDLGAIADISKIVFGEVSEGSITTDQKPVAENLQLTVTAYPNPAADHIHVDGVAEGETLRLFSADGKLVYRGSDADINLSGMAKGIYILQAGKQIVKIIKQ